MKIRTSFLLIILTLTGCHFQFSKNNNPTELKGYGICDSIENTPERYELNCEYIKARHLTFPFSSVSSGKIYKNKLNDYGTFEKGEEFNIDSVFINCCRLITSDSTNFEWGELGTLYTDYIVEFYDANGQLINQAEISYDGMLQTFPLFKTTKWGLLTSKGETELKTLMNKYTKEKNK